MMKIKRTQTIEDFAEIKKGMAEIFNYTSENCETERNLMYIVEFLYSVYLYLDYTGDVTVERLQDYFEVIGKYWFEGRTVQYHFVNTVKMKFEDDYWIPWHYTDVFKKESISIQMDVMLYTLAITKNKNNDLLSWIIERFAEGTN